jgi:hypothetical protein
MSWRYLSFTAICASVLLAQQLVQPASASTLDISFLAAVQTGSPGGTLTFTGTVANNSGLDLFVNEASINLTGFDPGDSDLTDFGLNFTGPLSNGSSIGPADLFTVAIPDPFPTGSYTGEITIQGGIDDTGDLDLGTASFELDVSGATTSSAPEPGSPMLVMTGLVLMLAGRKGRRCKSLDQAERAGVSGRRPQS